MAVADPIVALVTSPREEARRVASAVVERRLAACVSIVPLVESVYWWEGAMRSDDEALLIVKTTRAAMSAIDELLREIHPYDTFELVSLEVEDGSAAYLDWIRASVELGAPGH